VVLTKTEDAGLGFIEGTFDIRHKSHITGSCKKTCCGEETIQRPVNHVLNADGRMKKLSVTSLLLDRNSMASHLNRSGCEGF